MTAHSDVERVGRLHMDLLSPMVVEEILPVEAHELANQAPISVIRRRLDREVGAAEELGKIVNTQCHLTHHAEAAALNQTPQAYGRASAALNIFPAFGRNRVVGLHADRSSADCDRWLRL